EPGTQVGRNPNRCHPFRRLRFQALPISEEEPAQPPGRGVRSPALCHPLCPEARADAKLEAPLGRGYRERIAEMSTTSRLRPLVSTSAATGVKILAAPPPIGSWLLGAAPRLARRLPLGGLIEEAQTLGGLEAWPPPGPHL